MPALVIAKWLLTDDLTSVSTCVGLIYSRLRKEEPESSLGQQSHPKPLQCDIKATTKRVDCQPIATPMRPQANLPKATSMLPR
jgi:hypothetical protein